MARKPNIQGAIESLMKQFGDAIAKSVAEGIAKSGLMKELSKGTRAAGKTVRRGRKLGRKPGRKPGRKRKTSKKCKVAGCNNEARSKGLCSKHYQRARFQALKKKKTGKKPAKKTAKRGRKPKKTVKKRTGKKAAPKKKVTAKTVRETYVEEKPKVLLRKNAEAKKLAGKTPPKNPDGAKPPALQQAAPESQPKSEAGATT